MNTFFKHLGACALFVLALSAYPANARQAAETRVEPWSDEVIALGASLPIQDGGRIKPLNTFAGVTLLRLNGKRSVRLENEERLGPTEWLLDVLLFPEAACDYSVFLVQNEEVVAAIGVDSEGKKKRDRYSFNELRTGVDRLFELAREYAFIDAKDRSTVQQQVFLLANNVDAFMQLAGHFDFARQPLLVPQGSELAGILGDRDEVSFADVVRHVPEIEKVYRSNTSSEADRDAALGLLRAASALSGPTAMLPLIPPIGSVTLEPEWKTPADLFTETLGGTPLAEKHGQLLVELEELVAQRSDPAGFENALTALHTRVSDMASLRGEYDKIGLELTYYKLDLISRSLYLFVLAFLAAAILWLRPRSKVLYLATSAFVAGGTGLLCFAIVMRCIIRSRPPVSTLYETVLFVTAVGAIVALFIEFVGKKRIAISSAAILGAVGMFVANGYELLDKQDTMPSLVAVLDTNFWLATHVTSITIGYSAGMFAALLGSVYLIAKLLRVRGGVAGDRAFYASLARMVYGVLCFGLIFSTVGTILGGVWANDSWGRFWGWDPKENGALLIVLSQIAILHARMGGLLREHGVCMAAAFGGTIVAFSWWGVNLLGVGLHSYGFTSGIHSALWSYYAAQWGIVGLGAVAWVLERRRSAPQA
jgi:ABC-type transport system involved in cytochrome c biogenesis permease subunit